MRKKLLFVAMFIIAIVVGLSFSTPAQANGGPTYQLSPNTKPINEEFLKYSTYNQHTKHYYLLRSYLEQLEKTGGGTIVLKKGTYTISNALYVPSNVTIKLENGAKLVKGAKTGTSTFGPAKSIFQLIRPSRAAKSNVYGKHEGEKNITIIGSGKAVIDLNFVPDSFAIIAGHNRNLTIKNIEFINMNSGHFIEIDGTKDAVISNNKFMYSKASKGENKEAINIDTPDKTTLGWSLKWSKFDKTPNVNMLIENNYFYDLDRAIGTHKYSGGKLHDKIIIRKNVIEKMRQDPIRVMNWKNPVIERNHIKDVAPGPSNNKRAILASGTINPIFQHNVFENVPRAVQFMAWKNSGPGSQYDTIYDQLNNKSLKALETNVVINGAEDFIRINKVYDRFDNAVTDRVEVRTGIFSDFLDDHSGYEEALELIELGHVNGYNDNTFRPNNSISRQNVAALFHRTLSLEVPRNLASNLSMYEDIDAKHTYAKEIASTTAANIFLGGNGDKAIKFNPENPITRGQMATTLVRAFNLENTGEEVDLVDLESIDEAHRENVIILAQNEITKGKVDKNGRYYFDAGGKVSRIQFVLFLHRALNNNQ